ncbi:hypothetical protein ACET3X_000840 [Alternaria dauci]|uniref:Uncharacterized protein n=1 Tax=Alternaria dauci TaxID=48095 RepID=A0ABR3UVL9_9PLEO
MTPESQIALLQVWAEDIGHVVDLKNSPKAEFTRLAKAKGWIGGSDDWCRYWKQCFNETYLWGAHNRSRATGSTANPDLAGQIDTLEVTDHVRKLSVGSGVSSFLVVSRTSRANSFGSVRSLNSDQSCEGEDRWVSAGPQSPSITLSWDNTDSQNTVLSLGTVKSPGGLWGGAGFPSYDWHVPTHTAVDIDTDGHTPAWGPIRNPAWYGFSGFVHNPRAPFKEVFERLARIKGWNGEIKRHNMVALLRLEVAFWNSKDVDKLEGYQYLCREMGIEKIPCSVAQAKKALRSLKVNLYSVIDHMRNPEIKIVTYKTMHELRLSVYKMGTFPRDCAKAGGGFMSALLSKL